MREKAAVTTLAKERVSAYSSVKHDPKNVRRNPTKRIQYSRVKIFPILTIDTVLEEIQLRDDGDDGDDGGRIVGMIKGSKFLRSLERKNFRLP